MLNGVEINEEINSYIIWVSGSLYYAKNCNTGLITNNSTFTTLINACITSVNAAGGGNIFIKMGAYIASASIIGADNVSIIGEGKSTVITRSSDAGTTRCFDLSSCDYMEISNMTVNYANNTTGTNRLFWCEDATRLYIHDIYVTTYRTNVVFWRNTNHCTFRRIIASGGGDVSGGGVFTLYYDVGDSTYNLIEECENYGNRGLFQQDPSAHTHHSHNIIKGCISVGAKGDHIVLLSGYYNMITGCTVVWEGNTEQMNAIDVRAGDHNIISNNLIYDNGCTDNNAATPYVGVFFGHGGGEGTVIIGNTIDGGDVGVCLYGGSYALVTGNTIINANNRGIQISDDGLGNPANYNTIRGNMIRNSGAYGIEVNSGEIGNVVEDNEIFSSGTSDLIENGTNTTLRFVVAPFVKEIGTASWISTTYYGIDVDAADEGGLAFCHLPDSKKLYRIKIWGIAQADPGAGNGMMLNIAAYGSKENEAYNTEAVTSSKVSSTDDVPIGNRIMWSFTSSDDADLDDIMQDEGIQLKAYYSTSSGSDIATDVCLQYAVFEYY